MYISQQIAANAVSQVLSGRNLTLALPDAQKQFATATPQQRGAAADLSYGTLRFYGELEIYLNQLLEKPLSDGRVHALLLVALYQLLHDKADDFTIVNQSVKAASFAKPKWAKGLVNGVLRNFLRKQTEIAEQLKGNEVAQYSYPQWWITKVKAQYPQHWQSILMAGNAHPPMTLRVNRRKISTEEYMTLLHRQGVEAEQIGAYAVMLTHAVSVEKITGFSEGVVSVQDYGAQFAPKLLDLASGMRVLDACCAPGGKTGHILESAEVELTAIDSDASRLTRVASNLDRLSLKAQLRVADASQLQGWYDGQPFDRILADVPCSASGIVRRHVDIKWLRRETDIVSFVQQQSAILLNLWQLLAKGGKLLYVTCSIFDEENQQQIDRFLKTHDDARQLPIQLDEYLTQRMVSLGNQLIPNALHDGLYYALLQKI
ncbi:MAG TPA: 16S rRNA (cytosine(967)-C(5))-methyltransferase RsmB [Methylophilaceae bacterium]|nr:16S rRNA (cytosine(967)-C(5))-methyltransferase RsmB [Methylophilaceae bacterium]HAJ72297.1 16S rRNA (cytosine(967)-C(5))-methyltransferase RsmB [Methylophilaceae bacterium]